MTRVRTDFDTPLDLPTLEHLRDVALSQRDMFREMGAGWELMADHWDKTVNWITNTIKIAKGINPYVTTENT